MTSSNSFIKLALSQTLNPDTTQEILDLHNAIDAIINSIASIRNTLEVTETYDVTIEDSIILCDPVSGNIDITVPDIASIDGPKVYSVKHIGAANTVNVIATDDIDGVGSVALNSLDSITIVKGSSSWWKL